MKKTTTAMLLILAVAFTTSCKKEKTSVQNDFILNQSLDNELFANAASMTKQQLQDYAQKKFEVLNRIKNANPDITAEKLYPNINFKRNEQQRVLVDCWGQFNTDRNICNISYIGSCLYQVGIGFAVGWVFPPAGIAIGAAGVAKETLAYAVCIATAVQTRDNCFKSYYPLHDGK